FGIRAQWGDGWPLVQGAGLTEADLPNAFLRRQVGLPVIGASQIIGRRFIPVVDQLERGFVVRTRRIVPRFDAAIPNQRRGIAVGEPPRFVESERVVVPALRIHERLLPLY